MALLIYVDDIILVSDSETIILSIKQFLNDAFSIKDLVNLKYFLGLEIDRSSSSININQHKYVLDLLQDNGFLNAKPASTPKVVNVKLSLYDSPSISDSTFYHRLVGRLLYLYTTRPDISHDVQ